MTSVMRYNVEDFNKIIFDGFTYKLSDETMQAIQTIADQVGAPEYVRTPQFPKRDRQSGSGSSGGNATGRRRRGKAPEITDADWKAIREFQATEIVKKEGIDASIDLIRKHLNKMTTKSYETLKKDIVSEISLIVADENADDPEMLEKLNKIGDSIFNIASGNGFFSEMYATLYKDLMEQFDFMSKIFTTNFDKFRSLFHTIEYCDPNENYDKFCDNNKANEKRRAVGLFYVNLMKAKVVGNDAIISIIGELQEYMMRLIDGEDNKNVVEELSEIIFILMTSSVSVLKSHDDWKDAVKKVVTISKMKVKEKPSISNKTIFRHMDILDKLN
jgi:hypothetical protein